MTVSVLLADDQHLVRAGFRSLLKRDRQIVVAGEAATGDEAVRTAQGIWTTINAVNLHENVLPTRGRAHLVLEKGPTHAVERVLLRKL